MRVVHIAFSMDPFGGATRAANAIHRGVIAQGVESSAFVQHLCGEDLPHEQLYVPNPGILTKIRSRLLRRRDQRDFAAYSETFRGSVGIFGLAHESVGAEVVAQLPPADIYHLHWTGSFLNLAAVVPALAKRAPVIWTLQDESAYTGGCYYAVDCQAFTTACGRCPELGSTQVHDLARRQFDDKRRLLAGVPQERLHVVGISRWLTDQVAASALLQRFARSCIHSGLDAAHFSPGDRAAARERLGIPQDARVVQFVAAHTKLPVKGYDFLLKVLAQLHDIPNLYLLSLGRAEPHAPEGIPCQHLGHVQDGETIRDAYRAADLFVNPTRIEAFGLTTIEAMACGTPVVGSAVGGLLDTIRDGETGYLVPLSDDPTEMAARCRTLLTDHALRDRFAARGIEVIREAFTQDLQTQRYLELYDRVLAAN